jgi:hypothetical protein
VPPASDVAHSEQNFAVGELGVRHVGQTATSRSAHSLQNLAPAGLSLPQFEQITRALLQGGIAAVRSVPDGRR